MIKPLFVLISDIHFNISTLPLASAALRQAVKKAEDLNVPLVIAGDLNDTKALLRAEVVRELLEILEQTTIQVKIITGNHDLLNHHANAHSLKFLEKYAKIYDTPIYTTISSQVVGFVPYQVTNGEFLNAFSQFKNSDVPLIIHQGVQGAFMGDYVQDKSSIDPCILGSRPVFSGHYHKHQTVGPVTYIGSPYTITFGEAKDGPKGFLIVNDDWSFTQVPTGLRKHVIVERDISNLFTTIENLTPQDLLWLKVTGERSLLELLDKVSIGNRHLGHANYKLDKIYIESDSVSQLNGSNSSPIKTDQDLLDSLIDSLSDTEERKNKLKITWRSMV